MPEEVSQQAQKLCVTPVQIALVEPSSSSQLPLTDDIDEEPVCPACLDSPEAACTSQASPDALTQAETESTLSEDDEGQYESMAEQLEALLQSPGGESQLPPHTDLCTLDFDQFYF